MLPKMLKIDSNHREELIHLNLDVTMANCVPEFGTKIADVKIFDAPKHSPNFATFYDFRTIATVVYIHDRAFWHSAKMLCIKYLGM